VQFVALEGARTGTAVDLVTERLPHQSRDDAAYVFEHPEVFTFRTLWEARDADGAMLGVSFAGRPRWMNPDRAFLRVVVLRQHEGHGIGRALHAHALGGLDDATVELVGGVYDDEPRSLEVARHWGFQVDELSIESELPLDADLPEPRPGPGVTLEDASDLEFADREAVDAMLVRSQTNPEARVGWLFDLDRLAASLTDDAPAVCTVARVDGAPAAITFGDVSAGVLSIAYSGVDPALRGRGLMVVTKQHAHLTARDLGAHVARTSNEEHNAGIRRINTALGYRVTSGTYRMRMGLGR
jgi:GNAT superfamily N-acetyltransferase